MRSSIGCTGATDAPGGLSEPEGAASEPREVGTTAPPRRRRRPGADALLVLTLWLLAAALNLWLVRASVTGGVLTGEEASVSHLYVLALPEHVEVSVYATNFASQLSFWVASHLDPAVDLFYGRRWKAVFTALLAPLVFLVLRRRLATGRLPAVAGAAAAVTLPGVGLFSWMATENGMEAVWGLAAVLVVTSGRRWWPAGPVLAGVAASVYSTGVAWAAVVLAVAAVRLVGARSVRPSLAVLGAVAAGTAVVLFPAWWWDNGPVLLTGGGALAPSPARVLEAARLLAVDGSSYYYFSDSALWVGPPFALALVLAVVGAVGARPRAFSPYLLLAVVSVLLYALAGNVTGARRLIALSVVAALAAGVVLDVLARTVVRRAPHGPVLATGLTTVLAACLVVPATGVLVDWGRGIEEARTALPVDFEFPIAPGATMSSTLAEVADDLRDGTSTVEETARTREGMRTFAMIRVVGDRSGTPLPGVPTPEQVIDIYRQSAICFGPDCRPRSPGRP